MTTLRFILGDQLSHQISSLDGLNPKQDVIFLCEVREEAKYVKHHKKKLAFLFSAMRHFTEELKEKGLNVIYVTLDDPLNSGSFSSELQRMISLHHINKLIVTEPGEYRVLQILNQFKQNFPALEIREDTRFLCSISAFKSWVSDRSSLKMEYFYRDMRKKYQVLLNNQKPEGGKWNYDSENRKLPPASLTIPEPYQSKPNTITKTVLTMVEKMFSNHFGDLYPFNFAVTREEAQHVLRRFIHERLIHFGDYQDAMLEGEPWMFHAHISFYLNCGLLLPLDCIKAAEQAYYDGKAPLNAVEGFIRQIMGWREYIRGIYWLKMPDYSKQNYLNSHQKLPAFFWTGETDMNCLKQCIEETKINAYAHHIQRLMVIGNFSLIAGLSPELVNEWFLTVYADAYEWVELPNVTGMILFADGGYLATKPYAASGSYINKMSNYCKSCRYKVTDKTGEKACPFNYLYWHFLDKNRDKLQSNPRMGMMYRVYDKLPDAKKMLIKESAQTFFNSLYR